MSDLNTSIDNLDKAVIKYLKASAEKNASQSRIDACFLEIHNILTEQKQLNLSDEVCATVYTNAVMQALKGYNPDKGKFINYFNKIYSFCRKQSYIDLFAVDSYIKTHINGIHAYGQPTVNSEVLRDLVKGRTYRVDAVVDDDNDGTFLWFKIKLKINDGSSTVTAYVQESSQIGYFSNSTVSADETDDDTQISLAGKIADESADFENEFASLSDWTRFIEISTSEFLEFHKDHGKNNGKNQLTIYDCYRMFYTEDLINVLHEYGDNFYPPYRHETMAMRLCNKNWKDYILTKECSGFREIIMTQRHSYHHYLENNNNNEISMPPEIKIRGKFIRENMKINRDDDSLKVSISKYRKEYSNKLKKKIDE